MRVDSESQASLELSFFTTTIHIIVISLGSFEDREVDFNQIASRHNSPSPAATNRHFH